MKKLNSKSLMVLTILVASTLAMPAMVAGSDTDDNINLNQFGGTNPSDLINNFGGFGNIFSNYLGPSGALLGQIFLMLFNQTLDIEQQKVSQGLYVMNATITKPNLPNVTYDFDEYGQRPFYLPQNYSDTENGYYYCETDYSGNIEIEVEVGGSITLIIWDQDESFINALKRLISAIKSFMTAPDEQTIIQEAISAITWFLIHINDIFNGNELFVMNPMTYQKLTTHAKTELQFNKDWKFYNETSGTTETVNSTTKSTWLSEAEDRNDGYIRWLLTNKTIAANEEITWTQFSFDIFQFWMRNFQININVADLLTGGANIVSAFSGCDIEFYLFTHSLAGTYLFEDTDGNERVTANYTEYGSGSNTIELPELNELAYMLHLKDGDYDFREPEIVNGNVEWGLNITNPEVGPVPIGTDTETYFNETGSTSLNNIYFGLQFIPSVSGSVAQGRIKLVHHIAPLQDSLNSDLDLAVMYISSILHFHLTITNVEESAEDPLPLLQQDDYRESEESIKIGNYLGVGEEQLEFVDIAGQDYVYGDNDSSTTTDDALSSYIPIALYTLEASAHKSYEGGTDEYQPYAANASLILEYNMLGYAVSYPKFDGGINGIFHDPTFNVFMVFEPTAFWALILLIGGISILGIATILIKRKKDGKAPF
ncbi:MAG: hypothetical protein GF311_25230 [Candidatus Lokiarchaeota archaeon]|nr:hypothetical protein [Candidatus Lokiarchaeota archaeon]